MAGHSQPPPHDPSNRGRVPGWMLRNDELMHTSVLLMQIRMTDVNASSSERVPRLPSDHFLIGNAVLLALGPGAAEKVHASKEAGGAKYILRTKSKTICEKLKQIRELPDKTPIEIIEHPTLNTVQGVVFESDGVNHSEEYILENLKSQGVIAARRIKKRDGKDLRNTPLVVLTFSGTTLPEYVLFGLLRVNVRRYYPAPMMCFRCANFGHTRRKCDPNKNKQVCLTCSGTHEIQETPCINPVYCKNCNQNHSPISKQCAVYREEEGIIRLKIDRNLSYSEARSEFRRATGNTSYATVTQHKTRPEESDKDRMIKSLQEQIVNLTKVIADLKAQKTSVGQQGSICKQPSTKVTNSFSQPKPQTKNCYIELTRSSSYDELQINSQIHRKQSQPNYDHNIEGNADNMDYENTRSHKRKGNKKNGGTDSPDRKKCPTAENISQSEQSLGMETRNRKK